jgi:hypothetical protein
MTNRIAIVLGVVLAAAVAANFLFGWEAHVAAGRWLADTVEWMAFWR